MAFVVVQDLLSDLLQIRFLCPVDIIIQLQLVADKAGLGKEQWSWIYQSAGRSPDPWLGPQLPEHLEVLAKKGIRDVVSVPVGFVSDHVEILYNIDIQAQKTAKTSGIRLERPPALNEDPLFITALASLIQDCVDQKDWHR